MRGLRDLEKAEVEMGVRVPPKGRLGLRPAAIKSGSGREIRQ